MYAATDRGLYRLDVETGGANWELLGMEHRSVSSFAVISDDSLLTGTMDTTDQDSVFLYATFDGGSTWQPHQNGFGSDTTYRSVVDMAAAGPANDTLFAVSKGDIYRSSDRGQSWTPLFISEEYEYMEGGAQSTTIHSPITFRFIKADFQEFPLVYAGGQDELGPGGFMFSSDAGEKWASYSEF